MNEVRYKTKTCAAFLLCGAAAAALAILFPLSGDDWQWALESVFPKFNGRYLGNLLTMLLTQYTWLRPLFFGVSFAFIAYALSFLFEVTLIFTVLFLTLVPATMFAQVYQWTSGFSVFLPPVSLLLACVLLIKAAGRVRGVKKAAATLALCVFSFAGALFVEHMTVLALAMSISWLVFRTAKTKKADLPAILSMFFIAVGAVFMFSNPAYSNGYNITSHTLPNFSRMFLNARSNFIEIAAPSLVSDNTALTLMLCALAIKLTLTRKTRLSRPAAAYFTLYAAYIAIRPFFPYAQYFYASQLAEAAAAAIFFILFWVTALTRLTDKRRRQILAAILATMAFTCATLLAVNPTGARCYFICYILWIAAAAVIWSETGVSRAWFKPAALSLLAAVYICCLAVYGYSALAVSRRGEAAENAQTRVEVQWIPFDKWLWQINPTSDYLRTIYKNYYALPSTCEIIFTD